jgi:hypothetical protein
LSLAEFLERHAKILQIRILAFDMLPIRSAIIADVFALRNATVTIDVIAFVFGLKELA